MQAFLTGGTGFIGSVVCRQLIERGNKVKALVRSSRKGERLRSLGCEVVEGDLSDTSALKKGIKGCDAVFHVAAMYELGIPESRHAEMYEANVTGTERVMDVATELEIPRIVYVSTVAALGDTDGQIVDEAFVHRGKYLSYYEETKHLAHKEVMRRIEQGLPAVVVMPGAVYGPGDESVIGDFLGRLVSGRLPMIALADTGFTFVYVDDVASGVVAAYDRGTVGEMYILGGEMATTKEMIDLAARVAHVRRPFFTMPTPLVKMSLPFAPLISRALGLPPNLKELVASADGVTYLAKSDKARRDLGYDPRGLEQGLEDTLASR